jgi:antitoxin component YwqK of YwqJK toxin-antitoxin module
MFKILLLLTFLRLITDYSFAEKSSSICKDNPDGIVKEYYPGGSIMIEWNCQGGHLNGVSTMYYEDGTIKKKSNYTNDQRDGITYSYFENGNLSSECRFDGGDLDGEHKFLNEDGSIKELKYYEKGKELDSPAD